jgi:fucose permease
MAITITDFISKRFNVICYVYMLMLGFIYTVFQSLFQEINVYFGLEGAFFGILITLYFLGSLFAPAIAGEISDRAGKKVTLIISCILMATGTVILSLAHSVILAGVGILVMGGGGCTFEGLLSAKITDENPNAAEKFMNFSQVFFCIGAFLGPLLSRAVKLLGGSWQIAMIASVCIFIPALISVIFLPDDKKATQTRKLAQSHVKSQAGAQEELEKAQAQDSEHEKSNKQTPEKSHDKAYSLILIKDFRFIIFFFSMLLYTGAESGVGFFITSYYNEAGFAAFGEIVLSLFWAGMIIGRLLAGILYKQSERIFTLCIISSIVFSVLLQLPWWPTIASIALFFFMGMSLSSMWPLLMAFCTLAYKRYSGTAGGLMMIGSSLGGMLLPAMIGFASSIVGVRSAFIISSSALISIMLLNYFRRKKAVLPNIGND